MDILKNLLKFVLSKVLWVINLLLDFVFGILGAIPKIAWYGFGLLVLFLLWQIGEDVMRTNPDPSFFDRALTFVLSMFFQVVFPIGMIIFLIFIVHQSAISMGESMQPVKVAKGNGNERSGFEYTEQINDFSSLKKRLFYRNESGEPLVADSEQPQNLDDWGLDKNGHRNRYTVSTQERGLILGVSGTGKSTYLITQLLDWIQSGKSFVVTDIKPEIWAILHVNGVFERYGYDDIVINPTDLNADKYNMFDDITDDNDVTEILNIIIPDKGGDGDAFATTARLILKSVLLHLQDKNGSMSLTSARDYVDEFVDIDEMLDELMNSESRIAMRCAKNAKRSASNERYLASAVTAMINALDFLDNEKIAENIASSDVSLRDELQKPKKAVFLQFDKQYKETTRVLFGATLAHVLRLLEVNFRDREEVFVAIDEIINASPIPRLTEKLNVIRSSKMPLFMYLQTLEGLNRVYGDKADEMFMSACALKVCYRIDDIKTAQMMSDFIGTVEVKKWSLGEKERQTGMGAVVDDVYSEQTELMPKVEPVKLTQLGKGQAVICYSGESAIRDMPYFKRTFSAMKIDNALYVDRTGYIDYQARQQALS